MTTPILDLALVMSIAAGLGILARYLRQPLILAYIAAGIAISTWGVFHINDTETFQIFSDLGIMFLLFLVGLEINYTSLRLVGKPSLIIGGAHTLITFVVGFVLSLAFEFDYLTSAYIAIAFTFSSTIIVIKLLSDKRDLNSLYGKITVGFLLVQDIIAIFLLVLLSAMQPDDALNIGAISFTLLKGAVLFAGMYALSVYALPRVSEFFAGSQELLFLASLAWVFIVGAAVSQLGFSLEIGGFLAGIALANASEHSQIASRIRPLRDFFVVIFFVILGSILTVSDFTGLLLPVIVFTLFVLAAKPLIMLIVMRPLGYRKRTSFYTGILSSQVSEFSLILVTLGQSVRHIDSQAVSLVSTVAILTIIASTYFISHAAKLFAWAGPYLGIFEREEGLKNNSPEETLQRPIVLFGYHRTGQSIAAHLPKNDLLVVDFDPESIDLLKKQGFTFLFDDMNDSDIWERAGLNKAHLIISTAPNFEDNLMLLSECRKIREKNHSMKIIVRAKTEEELKILYHQGADYVLLPHFTAGQYLGRVLRTDPHLESLERLKAKDFAVLRKEQNDRE